MTEVAKLDDAGLEELIANSESGRVCARFELDRGRPRMPAGLAAGLMVVALAGCATPATPSQAIEPIDTSKDEEEHSGAAIMGVITDPDGRPLEYALVILMSTTLPYALERVTNERGIYRFVDLPPGNYTIQVLLGKAHVSKLVELPQDGRFRAYFRIHSEREEIVGGILFEPSVIDTTSASSRY